MNTGQPRISAPCQSHCPRCQAQPGQPCRNEQGQTLAGVHFQRQAEKRKAIAAAFYLYRPLVRP